LNSLSGGLIGKGGIILNSRINHLSILLGHRDHSFLNHWSGFRFLNRSGVLLDSFSRNGISNYCVCVGGYSIRIRNNRSGNGLN